MENTENTAIKFEFKKGDHVVYPLQGVGLIKDIRERKIRDRLVMCYVIYIEMSDMTVSIPVDKVAESRIRSIVDARTAQETLDSISSKYEAKPVDWKERYQENLSLVKEGSIQSFSQVVQWLYNRSKVKELPVQERRLYDNAVRILTDECSLAMGKESREIERLIFSKLEG